MRKGEGSKAKAEDVTGAQMEGGGIAELVPTCNKIQDLMEKTMGHEKDLIQLPRICVIGSQSSGKSSLLESLVGALFLPKGTGVVTRRPIILRLINTPNVTPWIEFEHLPNRRFEDFAEVESEIIRDTNRVAGPGTNISHDPIKITVHSPNVLSFTVIDLPGIVKNPDLQQAEDIELQIKDLILSYISDENTIILAVAKGNDEVNNAESINLAKSVDPTQSRTLAVVTKLDLAEDQEKMLDTLKGNIVKVKLGIVGVINRSKEDLQINKPFAEVLAYERAYIRKHYPTVAWQHGIPVLAQKLHRLLSKRIAAHLPSLFVKLGDQQLRAEKELEALGENSDLSEEEKLKILSEAIQDFSNRYQSQVYGQGMGSLKDKGVTRGTVINDILQFRLSQALKSLDPFKNVSDANLMIAVRNAMPVGAKIIIPEVALNHFIMKEIDKVEPIALNIMKLVYQQMQETIGTCLDDCPRFPKMNSSMSFVASNLIDEKMLETRGLLKDYFEVQGCASWTANENFETLFRTTMKDLDVVDTGHLSNKFLQNNGGYGVQEYFKMEDVPIPETPKGGQPSAQGAASEDDEGLTKEQSLLCQKLRSLAANMFEIVRWQLQDYIAKAILTRLIFKTVDNLAVTLNTKLEINKPEKIDEIVQEGEDIQARRVNLKNEIEYQKEALALLNKVKNDAM